eukprot:scaffold136931_cov32-Tisochrysis_lutea.AAC.6
MREHMRAIHPVAPYLYVKAAGSFTTSVRMTHSHETVIIMQPNEAAGKSDTATPRHRGVAWRRVIA